MKIDLTLLENSAQKIRSEGEMTQDGANQMAGIADEIQLGWKSPSAGMFMDEMVGVQNKIQQLSERMDQLSDTLEKIVEDTKNTEETNKDRLIK